MRSVWSIFEGAKFIYLFVRGSARYCGVVPYLYLAWRALLRRTIDAIAAVAHDDNAHSHEWMWMRMKTEWIGRQFFESQLKFHSWIGRVLYALHMMYNTHTSISYIVYALAICLGRSCACGVNVCITSPHRRKQRHQQSRILSHKHSHPVFCWMICDHGVFIVRSVQWEST